MQTADPSAIARNIESIAEITQIRGHYVRAHAPANAAESMTPNFAVETPQAHFVGRELLVGMAFRCIVVRTGADANAVAAQLNLPEPPADLRFFAEAAFIVRYTLRSGFQPTQAEQLAFAQVNAPINIVPYWREFLDSAARRCGVPPIFAPVYVAEPRHSNAPVRKPRSRPSQKGD